MRRAARARAVALAWAAALLAGVAAAQGGTVDDPSGSWRLVRILGMDDSVAEARPPSRFTLTLEDGRAFGRADCNLFSGPAEVDGVGIVLGPLASTRAACAPGSLSDRYLQELSFVRTFVIEGGALYLATMADGSILEFVRGLPVRRFDGRCEDGRELDLVAGSDWAGLVVEDTFFLLPRVVSASGVRWAEDGVEAWNRGEALALTGPRDAPRTACALTPAGGTPP